MTATPLPLPTPLLDDPAENFHLASRISPLIGHSHTGPYPERFFAEPDLHLAFGVPTLFDGASDGHDFAVPPGDHERGSVIGAMRERRSENVFDAGRSIPRRALAAILTEACGITDTHGRSAPSPGRLYGLDCFVVVAGVAGVAPGFYGFHPFRHRLVRLGIPIDPRSWFSDALAYRTIAATCGAMVFIAAAFDRLRIKYGQRGYRFALLEAGHVAQSLLLLAAAERVAACAVGGYFDDEVDRTLGLNGLDISVVHSVALGMPARGDRDD